MNHLRRLFASLMLFAVAMPIAKADSSSAGTEFFERHVRPILVEHCYECHSEQTKMREGGLLLDRRSGWLTGGDTGKAVVAGEPQSSLLLQAVDYANEDLQMPPDGKLNDREIGILRKWILDGAPGPKVDPGTTEFSRLGDQEYLFEQADEHWAFAPVKTVVPAEVADAAWNRHPIDRLVFHQLQKHGLKPSRVADDRTLIRRLYYSLNGLPPTMDQVTQFAVEAKAHRQAAIESVVQRLISSHAFGEHIGRMWLDVARYADTDSSYRPDTKTPHYFPFAFTYRDYVVDSFNRDTPINQFIKEQLAADLMGFEATAPQMAALGFLATGPHGRNNNQEAIDDRIDVTTRGLMGITASCARCHDHKYEPVPTADYYALHGVFSSITRFNALDETRLPILAHYKTDQAAVADYKKLRSAIDKKISDAEGKKARGNNRSVSQKIRETELAELLLFHSGAPAHAMTVADVRKPSDSFIALRGDVSNRGSKVGRRFLTVLDKSQSPFPADNSGRLALAERIVDDRNPLTARVYVNRIWGLLTGAYLVPTPSDFGLQGTPPTNPTFLDWLATDFVNNGWSTKHLVSQIVLSRTFQQQSRYRDDAAELDPNNHFLWRANRQHLSIEEIRDTMLTVAGNLDRTVGGRAARLWGDDYLKRRAIYGYVNRFNLDPTLRAFDFPSRMQTQSLRNESIVAPQALFLMNSPFVIDQAIAVTESSHFVEANSDEDRVKVVFRTILQREAVDAEVARIAKFVAQQSKLFEKPRKGSKVTTPWPLVAQALLMSTELQYVD